MTSEAVPTSVMRKRLDEWVAEVNWRLEDALARKEGDVERVARYEVAYGMIQVMSQVAFWCGCAVRCVPVDGEEHEIAPHWKKVEIVPLGSAAQC